MMVAKKVKTIGNKLIFCFTMKIYHVRKCETPILWIKINTSLRLTKVYTQHLSK
jgi:hypothetical protein